ncbi:hypothetical protein GCM10027256_10870 [Novispirillum itersonii subsp. nipponicum]|uniref:Uncharacterized protein n=1 Tax=Novispirillum itersonii TaxID=189 RepID=A0A7W9ZG95_NOVIT|nr:hypothetical protein [Novispirillum itersonii]
MIYEPTTLADKIYRFLVGNALVRSSAEYSRWMGRSRTYHNTLRQQHRSPSPEAWTNLASALGLLMERPLQRPTKAVLAAFLADIPHEVPQ